MRIPGNTRDGNDDAPIEPGCTRAVALAVGCHPDTTEVVAFDDALKPAPDARCRDLDAIAWGELLDSEHLTDVSTDTAELTQVPMRLHPRFREMTAEWTVSFPLRDRLEGKLHSVVPIAINRAAQNDRARPCLDNGARDVLTTFGDVRCHTHFSTKQCCHCSP